MFIRSFQYQIFPHPEQEQELLRFAGCRRAVWNWGLAYKRDFYAFTGRSLRYEVLAKELTYLKTTPAYAFLKACSSQVLQQALMDLEQSYLNYFQAVSDFKKGLRTKDSIPDLPSFQSRHNSCPTFRFPEDARLVGQQVNLPKIGLVDIKLHRPLDGQIKSATIKQDHRGLWFITLVSHLEVPQTSETVSNPIGVDAGLTHFLVDSNGNKTQNPRFYRKGQKKLRQVQKSLSRKRAGSSDRKKAKSALARTHARIRHQRQDFLHKLSYTLCKAHDVVCIEDLHIQGLTRTKLKGHAKSFYDAAHSQFRFYLQYKTQREGGQLIHIDRWFASSKICSHCQAKNSELSLSDRFWTCPCCNTRHDRDINAAINILREGLRILAGGNPESLNACRQRVRPEASQASLDETGTSLRNLAENSKIWTAPEGATFSFEATAL